MMVLSLVLAALQQPTPSQTPLPPLPPAWSDTSPFRRLDLPTPTLLREGSGRPGPRYWQQRVDYTIAVALDTATHTIAGRETIRYANNSPDTLHYLWLQLDQNLFRDDSRGAVLTPPDARFAARGFRGGFVLDGVRAVRRTGNRPATQVALKTIENSTLMRVDLDRPLAPGGSLSLDLGYSFEVPEHGADRMGREQFPQGWLYEIAQWYPRLAVYDDVRGWNTEQYLGQGEFYLEYGDIDFAITVPRGYIVAGTGRLTNPLEVLTPVQRERLTRALRSDSTVAIIARNEVGQPSTRPTQPAGATLTWRFSAKNVRDVAWATAPNFIWDASGWNGILMQSFYPPVADSIWRESTRMVRHSIKHYSEKWFPYPYPTAINVNGPVGGMEYPMLVFCANRRSREGLFGVTTHELGHEWFPMIVGSNERLYAWMDEGFNTFINIYSARAYFPEQAWLRTRGQAESWAQFAATGRDEPGMTPADRVTPELLGAVAYSKPATGLYLLRHEILDSTRFDAAFREYIQRWAFKHPTPAEFFRSMEDGAGEDLSWFWRGWFYRTDVVDQAVDSVRTRRDSSGTTLTGIYLSSPGGLPMPVDMRLTFADGTTERVRLPVEAWYVGNHFLYVRQLPKDLVKVEIDPDKNFPDVRRQNNTWTKSQAAEAKP
ncbi:MAG TPA: M1 family metallopeptidase [Gemmatimonadales bacterium]|nr:M1 family metallopeptidase [Gemmatimonadales bacterium]